MFRTFLPRELDDNQLEVLDPRHLPTSLQSLDVSNNRISQLNYGFTEFHHLVDLDISSNRVKAILPDFSTPHQNPNLTYM
ncbi:hypothetical protein EB796_002136 [Bugula neritina]|uniref:Uncharacterized protein n=1 Tax=Bugula neritina TaxID=10212 RepID=A0A7J7KN55_BUGNE|nr:hypothetical protein EB796_002136 [Bugula neritina]